MSNKIKEVLKLIENGFDNIWVYKDLEKEYGYVLKSFNFGYSMISVDYSEDFLNHFGSDIYEKVYNLKIEDIKETLFDYLDNNDFKKMYIGLETEKYIIVDKTFEDFDIKKYLIKYGKEEYLDFVGKTFEDYKNNKGLVLEYVDFDYVFRSNIFLGFDTYSIDKLNYDSILFLDKGIFEERVKSFDFEDYLSKCE